MAKIDLAHLLDIDTNRLNEYKFHAAMKQTAGYQPLDGYIDDRKGVDGVEDRWKGWQTYYGNVDRWKSGQYILSFMNVYPEGDNVWLFGGIWEKKGLNIPEGGKQGHFYDVDLTDQGQEYIGRLKIIFHSEFRNKYPNLNTVYSELEFSEILKAPYSGRPFCGYENVSLNFPEFESIVRANKEDWRATLCNSKGIYVIYDKQTGKKYVGSAYGESGIWHRWCCYVEYLHGGNKKLKELFSDDQGMLETLGREEKPIDYARKNFRLTLIEHWPSKTTDSFIIHRENFWKEALLSRGEFGYNAN